MTTGIARKQTPEELELEKKKSELSALEAELSQRELELATAQAELHTFERRYLRVVGVRYAELDDIEAQIAEGARPPKTGCRRCAAASSGSTDQSK
jgi:multidrug efflux pump subunit AcrA (membrane-fusion protein)